MQDVDKLISLILKSFMCFNVELNFYFYMQRAGLKPDVLSYALLINAYGKARREEEALAGFYEMLDASVRCFISLLSSASSHTILITFNISRHFPLFMNKSVDYRKLFKY